VRCPTLTCHGRRHEIRANRPLAPLGADRFHRQAMTPLLHPFLVNDAFGDPALYVEVKFARRGLLFDLGDLHALAPRKILRLTDICVSHMHVDHFIGFDQVLRVLIGREQTVRVYGPAGILDAVGHRLAGYAWNLTERFTADLVFEVTELRSAGEAAKARFRFKNRFRREDLGEAALRDGLLLDDGRLRVRAAVLDHGIPCLAFAVEETAHVNVWKSRLEELELPVGPWLRGLKEAVLRGAPDDTPVRVEGDGDARSLPLGDLKKKVLQIVPGQKIAYVVDAAYTEQNIARIVALAKDADILFIEACFAAAEAERAADRKHLTTAQAGTLGRLAGVGRLEPFHFSPRYAGEAERLRREAAEAFAGQLCDPPAAPAQAAS
jgi:ribonuclease Z